MRKGSAQHNTCSSPKAVSLDIQGYPGIYRDGLIADSSVIKEGSVVA